MPDSEDIYGHYRIKQPTGLAVPINPLLPCSALSTYATATPYPMCERPENLPSDATAESPASRPRPSFLLVLLVVAPTSSDQLIMPSTEQHMAAVGLMQLGTGTLCARTAIRGPEVRTLF
ncbi:hypothetical protein JMJ77_0013578 [Colletotrichum scovillei]|uniref:Uncharacterized protein n=1 Tax=Colletotrichum scovillei TaxID=1209932 RepID=A0A9P7UCS3_9PEZI|nr:hypothetical protein JMJ77_0013578 [Colletotrichum scovillei]KAG7069879.1 hypothetical protein JMJ76_0003539 [Colletotrichum scovillei]KAG7073836.1 hypothetical protein JMJ78_0014803 [Colletotrichum scovillei]